MSLKHSVWSSILALQHPQYVSRFQTFFGLERLPPEPGAKSTTPAAAAAAATTTPHRVNNRLWLYLFSLGTKLGYEVFYALFYSYMFWNVDSLICRRLVLVWSLIMYTGQALKDIVRWPRPNRDHVIVLEPEYSLEFGMPSTHAILALSIPSTLLYSMLQRYQFSVPIFVVGALCWISLICCSRLYLGMHSVLDIIAGLGLTAIFLAILLPWLNVIDRLLVTSCFSPPLVLCIMILLALVYPSSNNESPTRGDTCVMIATSAGFIIGSWLNYHLGYVRETRQVLPMPMAMPSTASEIAILVLRTMLGLMLLVLFRSAGTQVSHAVIQATTGVDPRLPSSRYKAVVEVPTKLFTYLCVGLSISFASPFLFHLLHIERVSMLTEI